MAKSTDVKILQDAGDELHAALKNFPCKCKRQFLYSGDGTEMCRRCKSMSEWELIRTGESPTLTAFNTRRV